MRFLFPLLLMFLISCGKSSTPSSSSDNRRGPAVKPDVQEEIEEDIYRPEEVDTVVETDLLDISMDVPVEISENRIMFQKTDSQMLAGIRANCSMSVESGEIWDYVLKGANVLEVFKGREKMTMNRVGEGKGIIGSWSWKGYEGRTLILRRMTFVSMNRVVMRTHCEE